LLRLRALSGGEADVQLIDPRLELEPIASAHFSPPDPSQAGPQEAARLLREALRLSLRRGAGPFRSAARLGFQPRAYQLVPLMMALKLDPIRLLIADDVGVGKTIEAGLILRELVDRGEIERLTVLCPPHLVEQWTDELSSKFDLDAVAVTAASAPRLERNLPGSESLFEAYPITVVSLDYIKAERRRAEFARACPPLVVVDEAHACVGGDRGRQLRHALLQDLARDAARHIILLTATPHSGDEQAFDRLIGLLDPAFAGGGGMATDATRERLARHYVQRRRIDIVEGGWGEERAFPRHETTEVPFRLDPAHFAFQEAVLDYCLSVTEGAGPDQRRRRLAFWGTLALMRCVGSSPAAAASALRNRLGLDRGDAAADQFEDDMQSAVFDEAAGALSEDDVEPSARLDEAPKRDAAEQARLRKLVAQAETLDRDRDRDPKLKALVALLEPLLQDGACPVVFCRFIATAEAVGARLRRTFAKSRIEVVTGALTAEERRTRVETMADADHRILVATDCLSEGINLQTLFDAVVHYDLSWNPTRHQQREGRVDRFGQPSPLVRTALMFGENSAIDGAVLQVILRKAEAIRRATGVTVPLPDDREEVAGALMHAVLLRKGQARQLGFDFLPELDRNRRDVETMWRDAEEGEKRSRTRFAQRPMRPEEVLAEWRRAAALLGEAADVQRFVDRALKRLDAPLEQTARGWRAPLDALPQAIRERLEARGLAGTLAVAFAGVAHRH